MQDPASAVVSEWDQLRARLPPADRLHELGRHSGGFRRRRGVPSAEALLRLALAHGPGGMSRRQTVSWAAAAGIASLTDAALNDRLHGACDFLDAVLGELLATRQQAGPALHWPGRCLRIADGSCLSRPGSRGTDWRLHAVYDLGRGGFSHLDITDGHGAEALERGAVADGEVRIADRNYGTGPAIKRYIAAAQGAQADYILRLRWSALRLATAEGQPFRLIDYLAALPPEQQSADLAVRIATGRGVPELAARLVIQRKPEAAAEADRQRLRRQASRRQKQLDPRSLAAAGFVVLATSLPQAAYPVEQVAAAYRLRWQIELAFKRLKSLLHIDRLPCRSQAGARSWLSAHLILALLDDSMTQDLLDSFP
jgi:Transposase DDE domain